MNTFCDMHLSCCVLPVCFSSRRRHTTWPRDWSSDVCSSDLPRLPSIEVRPPGHHLGLLPYALAAPFEPSEQPDQAPDVVDFADIDGQQVIVSSLFVPDAEILQLSAEPRHIRLRADSITRGGGGSQGDIP